MKCKCRDIHENEKGGQDSDFSTCGSVNALNKGRPLENISYKTK